MEAKTSLSIITINSGTLLGYKTLPLSQCVLTSGPFPGQTEHDWSGIYAQFSVENALSYLSNNYDRGHEKVSLVTLTTKIDINCIIYRDLSFADGSINHSLKAQKFREALSMQ